MFKWVVVIALVVLLSGAWQSSRRTRLRPGALPGDLTVRLGRRSLRLPLATTLVLSLLASLLMWLL